MNEHLSIFLATSILALGGLGLFMFKSIDNKDSDNSEYNEDSLFGSGSLFDWGAEEEDETTKEDNGKDEKDGEQEYLEEMDDFKPRRKNAKTQKYKKSQGNSRRKYY